MVLRADLSPRSMASVWLTGLEDVPGRCGEVCAVEIVGDTVTEGRAGVGAGIHAFRDPALREDSAVTPVALDLERWHRVEVDMGEDGCRWTIDGEPLRTTVGCATYPLEILVGVFDFPEHEYAGAFAEHEPSLEVDEIRFLPESAAG